MRLLDRVPDHGGAAIRGERAGRRSNARKQQLAVSTTTYLIVATTMVKNQWLALSGADLSRLEFGRLRERFPLSFSRAHVGWMSEMMGDTYFPKAVEKICRWT